MKNVNATYKENRLFIIKETDLPKLKPEYDIFVSEGKDHTVEVITSGIIHAPTGDVDLDKTKQVALIFKRNPNNESI